jgi:hypothetical protein
MLDNITSPSKDKAPGVAAALARWRDLLDELDKLDPFGVLAEFAICRFLPRHMLGVLREAGVDLAALARRWCHDLSQIPRLGRSELWDDGRRFTLIDEPGAGSGAMIFVVRDPWSGRVIDLAAWSPPRAPATRFGCGALLGAEHLFGFRIHEHLLVHATVLDWLRNLCRGVVILDLANAAPLLRWQPLLVTPPDYGVELEEALTLHPKIFFDDEEPPE